MGHHQGPTREAIPLPTPLVTGTHPQIELSPSGKQIPDNYLQVIVHLQPLLFWVQRALSSGRLSGVGLLKEQIILKSLWARNGSASGIYASVSRWGKGNFL